MANLVFNFKINQMAEIFDNDRDLKEKLIEYDYYTVDISLSISNPLRINQYKELSKLLLSEYDYISNTTIEELWDLRFKVTEIEEIFSKEISLPKELYKQIIYSFKYGTVRHFFKDNYHKFLPSMDADAISSTKKMKIFQEAFMNEYDKFTDIIDEMLNITDVDLVGNDYLTYLAQLLGYEEDTLIGKDSFRELAKNIIEIYRIKGTNYSFGLFFNFLGFEVVLDEFWFDKRFADDGYTTNPYTKSKNKNSFDFYLTPNKPTEIIPDQMFNKHSVLDTDLTEIRSHLWFNKKIASGTSIDKLLGINGETPEEGFDYSYFKTNVIQYSIGKIRSDSSDSEGELSEEELAALQVYSNFLTPIFIHKRMSIDITPFEDDAGLLLLSDDSVYDSNTESYEKMFKNDVKLFSFEPDRLDNLVDTELGVKFIRLMVTKDELTHFVDDDEIGLEEFYSVKYLKFETKLSSSKNDDIVSLWDYFNLNDNNLNFNSVIDLRPLDEDRNRLPEDTLGKIVDFRELSFDNETTASLILDDLSKMGSIPSFNEFSGEPERLSNYYIEDGVYYSYDDEINVIPWLFRDTFKMIIT